MIFKCFHAGQSCTNNFIYYDSIRTLTTIFFIIMPREHGNDIVNNA